MEHLVTDFNKLLIYDIGFNKGKIVVECKSCRSLTHKSKNCQHMKSKNLYIPVLPNHDRIFRKVLPANDYKTYIRDDEYKVTNYKKEEVVFKPIVSFKDAGLHEKVQYNIENKLKYKNPSQFQKCAIPIIQRGRDVLARSETGSGKSVGILAPIISKILQINKENDDEIYTKCIIIAPTRELCSQLHCNVLALSFDTKITTMILYGGLNVKEYKNNVESQPDIIICTPGRMVHFIKDKLIEMSRIRFCIIDEADVLVKEFSHDIEIIKSKLNNQNMQTIMFSATFLNDEFNTFKKLLRKFNYVNVGLTKGAPLSVKQSILQISNSNKINFLIEHLNEIKDITSTIKKVIIFVESIAKCDLLKSFIIELFENNNPKKLKVDNLHSMCSQEMRENILETFINGKIHILVATDIIAKGIDINQVDVIIQFDVAHSISAYIHRVGRAGRCGQSGQCITYFDPAIDNFKDKFYEDAATMIIKKSSSKKRMSYNLIMLLSDCEQVIPKWLEELAFSKKL